VDKKAFLYDMVRCGYKKLSFMIWSDVDMKALLFDMF
jgi:hypothetical protein